MKSKNQKFNSSNFTTTRFNSLNIYLRVSKSFLVFIIISLQLSFSFCNNNQNNNYEIVNEGIKYFDNEKFSSFIGNYNSENYHESGYRKLRNLQVVDYSYYKFTFITGNPSNWETYTKDIKFIDCNGIQQNWINFTAYNGGSTPVSSSGSTYTSTHLSPANLLLEYMQFQFSSPIQLSAVEFTQIHPGTNYFSGYRLHGSNDGTNFIELYSNPNFNKAGGITRTSTELSASRITFSNNYFLAPICGNCPNINHITTSNICKYCIYSTDHFYNDACVAKASCPNVNHITNTKICLNCTGSTEYFYNNACVAISSCPSSFHVNVSTKVCFNCSGPTPYFYNNSCVAITACPNSSHITDNNVCLNCTGLTPYFYNNACVAIGSCPNSFHINSSNVCLNCTGLTSYFYNNICVAISSCPNLDHFTENNVCLNCINPTIYFHNDECVTLENCFNANYWPQTKICECKITEIFKDGFCLDKDTNNCGNEGFLNNYNICVFCPLNNQEQTEGKIYHLNGKCTDTCLYPYVKNTTTSERFYCENCSKSNKFLSNNSCLVSCPKFYKRFITNNEEFTECVDKCEKSQKSVFGECYDCPLDKLYVGLDKNNKEECFSECPSNYTVEEVGKICVRCEINHVAINNTCILCKNNSNDNKIFFENRCISSCPMGYEYDSVENTCIVLPVCDNLIKKTSYPKTTLECVNSCDNENNYYKSSINEKFCVKCNEEKAFYDLSTKKCITKCPDTFDVNDETFESQNSEDYYCKPCKELKNKNLNYLNKCIRNCPVNFRIENNECKLIIELPSCIDYCLNNGICNLKNTDIFCDCKHTKYMGQRCEISKFEINGSADLAEMLLENNAYSELFEELRNTPELQTLDMTFLLYKESIQVLDDILSSKIPFSSDVFKLIDSFFMSSDSVELEYLNDEVREKMMKVVNENQSFMKEIIQNVNSNEFYNNTLYYEGKEITIQINDSSEESKLESIRKNLPYVEFSDCETKLKSINAIKEEDKLYSLNVIEKYSNTTFSGNVTTKIIDKDGNEVDTNQCDYFALKNPINSQSFNLKEYLDAKEKYGYDLFDPKDKFFNDVCTPYDNSNDTDLVVDDRKLKYDKTLECNSQGNIKGIPTEIDKYGYLTCNYTNPPNQANGNLATKIFDDIKDGNYNIFICAKYIFNKLLMNYGFYAFISISTIGLIVIIFHSIFFDPLSQTDKIINSDATTIGPYNVGAINIIKDKDIFSSNCKLVNIDYLEKNEFVNIEKIEKENRKLEKDSFTTIHPESNYQTISSNNLLLINPKSVGIKYNDNDNDNNNYEKSIDEYKKFDKNMLNSHSINSNKPTIINLGNPVTNNYIIESSRLAKKLRVFNYSIENFDFSIEKDETEKFTDSEFKSFCQNCKIGEDAKPQSLNDYNTLNLNMKFDKDERSFMRYFWDDFKSSQTIINLVFVTSIIQPFSIRLLLIIVSLSLEFFFNAYFFSTISISKQTSYKTTTGNITIIWKIVNEIAQSIWPSIITALLMSIINIFYIPPEEHIEDLNKGLLSKDKSIIESSITNFQSKMKFRNVIISIINLLIILTCWYYVIVFCSIYKNSNKELLYGTLISFVISSIILRIILSLLNVVFRTIAKSCTNKMTKCVFNVYLKIHNFINLYY